MDLPKEQRDLERQSTMGKTWKSCCITADKQGIKYFVQVGILGTLILTSLTMLIYDKDCNSQRNWAGLLMVAVGVFLPSPRLDS